MAAEVHQLYLIDGHSLLFKAYFAIRSLTSPKGIPTNAVFGFIKMIQKLIRDRKPTYCLAVFDSAGPTFREDIYEEYKANRPPTPDDFIVQEPYVEKWLEAQGIARMALTGFEADDLIGTLARQASVKGLSVVIVSADKDLFQLVDDNVKMLRFLSDDMQVYDAQKVKEKMGVTPEQIIDYLALTGDASDNIPGVPSIGPKSASALLAEFGSLDGIYAHLGEIKREKQRQVLHDNEPKANLSRRLSTINCEAPVNLDLEKWNGHTRPDNKALAALYEELGFRSLLEEARNADSTTPQATEKKLVSETEGTNYGILNTVEGLRNWIAEARRAPLIGIDTETTAVDAMSAELVGISVSCKPLTGYYIPVGHESALETTAQIPLDVVRRELGPLFADPKVKKCAQHFKYDVKILERHGFKIGGFDFDTMLAAYLLNPEKEHGLKFLARDRLGVQMTPISHLIGSGKYQITMAEVEIAAAAPYAAADADLTLRLANLLRPELEREGLSDLYEKIEHPLVEVLDGMERNGIKIDVAYFKRLSRELEKRLEELTAQIYESAGHPFNINSTKQVAQVLFEELKLPTQRKGKTGYSTDVSVLEALGDMHPLPNLLVEYRANEKLKSTYVDTLPKLVNASTGKIHTSYNQTIAATGRLSSSDPNLQNIPVRTALGLQIRKGFVPSEKGFVFLAADYSQIELRILAHLSGDATLKKTYLEGGDVHRLTASRIFGCSDSDVSPEMRDRAKIINFGIIYGMTAHRLATDFKIEHSVAQRFIDDYFRAYPGVKQWTRQTLESAREKGFVTTLSGRRRHLPDLNSQNRNVRMNAERIAINTPIQGTSADMIKLAMLRVWRKLDGERFKAKMLLQVHDELIFELPEVEVERLGKMVRKEMAEALPLDVPIQVDTHTGRNWGEC